MAHRPSIPVSRHLKATKTNKNRQRTHETSIAEVDRCKLRLSTHQEMPQQKGVACLRRGGGGGGDGGTPVAGPTNDACEAEAR